MKTLHSRRSLRVKNGRLIVANGRRSLKNSIASGKNATAATLGKRMSVNQQQIVKRMTLNADLMPPHGGYRKLKSFQVAQLIYDVTVRFCDRYINKRSRTHDQMVQAARSGVQNIAEGSKASGTSKKGELKLTNVARARLNEVRMDYEDFLR